MRTLVRLLLSWVVGLALLFPLGALYGAAGLPVYHSWGLAHGSFTTAIPALVAAAFIGLGLLPWFAGSQDMLPRLAACASVFVLVTVLFWVDQSSGYSWSLWHSVVYGALFAVFAILCARAKQPLLVPLFLLVPMLVDTLFGIVVTGTFDGPGLEMLERDLWLKFMPAAAATGMAAAVSRLRRAGEA